MKQVNEMRPRQKIGLFFGSFNPIHTGHLIIANYLRSKTGLDYIWFVVSPHNPLKEQEELFDENTRLELVTLAIEDNPGLQTCLREFSMEKPSYSYLTIETLQKEHPGLDFVLIIGSDNLEVFHKWKNYEKILRMIHILVYPRGAYKELPFADHPSVSIVEAPLLEISSTFIRKCIREGTDIRYMVPEAVYLKIKEGILKK